MCIVLWWMCLTIYIWTAGGGFHFRFALLYWMVIFRFEYALLISVLIAVTALVPYFGAYIGGFCAFMLLLMISPTKAIWFLVYLVVLQQLENNLIYPRVVGSSLGLPGIWVVLAAIVGAGVGARLVF